MPTTLSEQIKILVELQKIDAEIHRHKTELAAFPDLQKKTEAEFERKKARAKAAEDENKAMQLRQKQKESELASSEDKITKLQSQLYQLKSNKEYAAMEMEIKGLKADKSLLEEDILKLLDGADAAKTALAKEKELLAQEEKAMRARLEELKSQSDAIQQVVNGLDERRKSYAPNIEPRLLSQYERILKGRDGLALVPVTNGACGGCHLELPPQTIHETQLHDKWITCESCARILYWPL